MNLITGTLNMVSISSFNKGKANKIFNEVKKDGTKLVVKNNKVECVLISKDVYEQIIEALENASLVRKVFERELRLKQGKTHTMSEADVIKHLGISKKQLDKLDINLDDELE